MNAWEALHQGKEIRLNNGEVNRLRAYARTLPEEERNHFFQHFVVKYDATHSYNPDARCYVCHLSETPILP